MKIAIIGTAGRGSDAAALDAAQWKAMQGFVAALLEAPEFQGYTDLVSGGAAWADHLAVDAFLARRRAALELHLPAPLDAAGFRETSFEFDPGRTANHYHRRFSVARGLPGQASIGEIHAAIAAGAETTTYAGFKKRNLVVAKADAVLAFTFGEPGSTRLSFSTRGGLAAAAAGLKDGGTAHTYDASKAPLKMHVALPLPAADITSTIGKWQEEMRLLAQEGLLAPRPVQASLF